MVKGKAKLFLVLNYAPCHAEVWGSGFITPALNEGEWLASGPGRLIPEEGNRVPTGYVGPNTGWMLWGIEKSYPSENRTHVVQLID
jgi:hypothetical protein